MFPALSKLTLARAALLQDAPVYVQFYVTARCNLACQQCNIIYANSDTRECTLEEIKRIADNFATLGVAMVLLTGGEPFIRKDLPDIIRQFKQRGIHVRMQTNAFATEEQIHAAIDAGGTDISISLDSLWPERQEKINGGVKDSWHAVLNSMALFSRYLPAKGSFASLGCVLQRDTLTDVEDVIRFGTAASWYTSLVPIHVTSRLQPMNFRTFDASLGWRPEEHDAADQVVERVRAMRKSGFLLYDSDQYLDDIKRFVRGQATTWRSRNGGVCDTPNLYFAVLPNGDFAPCCDHRLQRAVPTYAADFPAVYKSSLFRSQVHDVASACSGCMYGSYPEMTISMRYMAAKMERVRLFFTNPVPKKWPLTTEQLLASAAAIRGQDKAGAAGASADARASLLRQVGGV